MLSHDTHRPRGGIQRAALLAACSVALPALLLPSPRAQAQVSDAGAVFRQVQTYRPTDGPVAAAYLTGSIYGIQVGDRALRGLDVGTEMARWEVAPPSGRIAATALRQGRIIMQAGDLLAVDAASGQIAWTYPLLCPTPLQCNQQVLTLTETSALIAGYDGDWRSVNVVDLATGQLQWPTWGRAPKIAAAGKVGDIFVLAGAEKPYPIVGLAASTGAVRWTLGAGIGDKSIAGVTSDDRHAYVWSHDAQGPEVVGIDVATGQVRGRVTLGRLRIESAPSPSIASGWAAIEGSYLISFEQKSEGDTLSVRKMPDGRLLWSSLVTVLSRPAVAGSLLLVHRRDPLGDVVEAFDLETGEARFAMLRKGPIKSITARTVGSLVQVGVSGVSPIAIGIRPTDGKLLTVGLPKAPDNVSIDSITGTDTTLVVVAGGSLYRLEAASVSAIGDELRKLLVSGGEGKARELFDDVHDLVGALDTAAPLTQLMTNHDMLVVESSLAAGDYAGAAARLTDLASPEHLRYEADVAAFIDAASDLLTRRLHDLGPTLDTRIGALQEIVRALRAASGKALELGPAWQSNPGRAAQVEAGLARFAFWMHLRTETEQGLQLLGQLATAPWASRKEMIDTYRGTALIGAARTMLNNASMEYKERDYVEAWAITRDVLQLPGIDSVIPTAGSTKVLLESLDPDSAAGKRDLKKVLKGLDKTLTSGATPERGWTAASCVQECQLAHQTCAGRPCANWRHCDEDQRACTESCQLGTRAPKWPQTQPATVGSPEWWNCR